MKKITAVLGLILMTSTVALANTEAMKIKIVDIESLHNASVSEEQIEANMPTKHIYGGQVVDREIAKEAFFRGETTCRVLVNGHTEKMPNSTVVELVMEGPAENRKMLLFYSSERQTFISFICQAQADEITRASIVKALSPLIEEVQ